MWSHWAGRWLNRVGCIPVLLLISQAPRAVLSTVRCDPKPKKVSSCSAFEQSHLRTVWLLQKLRQWWFLHPERLAAHSAGGEHRTAHQYRNDVQASTSCFQSPQDAFDSCSLLKWARRFLRSRMTAGGPFSKGCFSKLLCSLCLSAESSGIKKG